MIISRVPFRISFVGGGTDFEGYYKYDYGNVISATIDKYMYVTLFRRMDNYIHLRYSKKEMVDHVNKLEHTLVKAAMRRMNIKDSVEIATISDIPAAGSGLGSSSSLAVALLMNFAKYTNAKFSKKDLVEEACRLEIDELKQPIGRQDQYAACYGGLNKIRFSKDQIKVTDLSFDKSVKYNRLKWLENSSMLFYLGNGRKSGDILAGHKSGIEQNLIVLDRQRDLVSDFYDWLCGKGKNTDAGDLVSESWACKKMITPQASDGYIDGLIEKVMENEACGAKVCGAGSGGFLLVICEKKKQDKVRSVIDNLTELRFNFDYEGARLVYDDRIKRI